MSAQPDDFGLSLPLLGGIGVFVVSYAHLEEAVHWVAYRYLDIGEEASRAVIAGMRLGDVMSTTKRVVLARELDQQIYDDLDDLFGKVSAMATFRDKVVHRQWGKGPTGMILQNLVGAKSRQTIEQTPIDHALLTANSTECAELAMTLCSHLLTQEAWSKLDLAQYSPAGRALLRCPWFEKPGPPATLSQPRQNRTG